MAIFGLFGKKDSQPAAPADKNAARARRDDGSSNANELKERIKQTQRNVARATATAKKIDAIESEMSSEFIPTHDANSTLPGPAVTIPQPGAQPEQAKPGKGSQPLPKPFEAALPIMDMSTDFLLGAEEKTLAIEASYSEDTQVVEEAAILFANEQNEMVEQILQSAILDPNSKTGPKTAWRMLFDLYQIMGKQHQFENLSIEYANKFESSPPTWIEGGTNATPQASAAPKGATPTVPFSGKLDGNIIKLLERAQKLGETTKILRLDFSRVTAVDPVGCGLLMRMLYKLQDSQHDLVLVSAPELAGKIRAILQVGRRDETEAPWLLLLEILRLLNEEKDFEEASIDYCITFEVSPPAFVAPKNKVTTIEETNMIPKYSPMKNIPNFIPEYSE